MEYSKGIWSTTEYVDISGGVEVFNKPFGLGIICQCYGDNAIENSRMIAAAPELLEALESALGNLLCLGATEEWPQIQSYRSVITKAKGK